MINTVQVRMTNLFEQLGLPSDAASIATFIKEHQLDKNTYISEANFWNDGQRAFIMEKLATDDSWSLIVDQLNEALHEDNQK